MTSSINLPILDVQDLWFRYDDSATPALSGVHLSLAAGEWLAILGCNGSGKTTLVKHFNGLLRPCKGRVLLQGVDTAGRKVGQLARIVAYLPQNPDRLIFSATVREEVAFGPKQLGLAGDELDERVEQALALLGLTEQAYVPPAMLGYGLRRKVALASVLALRPRLLVLDEPTSGLHADCVRHFMEAVGVLHQGGTAVVLVTHELELANRYAGTTVLMRDGAILAHGETDSILTDSASLELAGLPPLPATEVAGQLHALRPDFPPGVLTPQELVEAYLACCRPETRA